MVNLTISVDEDLHGVLKAMAKLRDITVEEVLRDMLVQTIDELRARMDDPLIGLVSSGEGNISERDENILRSGWRPD